MQCVVKINGSTTRERDGTSNRHKTGRARACIQLIFVCVFHSSLFVGFPCGQRRIAQNPLRRGRCKMLHTFVVIVLPGRLCFFCKP